VSDGDFLSDTGAFESGAMIDSDPCLSISVCDQLTHPGTCPTVAPSSTGFDSALDPGTCQTRPTVSCDSDGGNQVDGDLQLKDLLEDCGMPMLERTVVVTFSGGCANHLYYSSPWPTDSTDTAAIACVLRELKASHFACADQFPCWSWAYSLIMHSAR